MNKGDTKIWYLDDQPEVVRRILVLHQSGGFRGISDSSSFLQPPEFLRCYYTHQTIFGVTTPTRYSSGLLHPLDFLLVTTPH